MIFYKTGQRRINPFVPFQYIQLPVIRENYVYYANSPTPMDSIQSLMSHACSFYIIYIYICFVFSFITLYYYYYYYSFQCNDLEIIDVFSLVKHFFVQSKSILDFQKCILPVTSSIRKNGIVSVVFFIINGIITLQLFGLMDH